jgi:hypothetical protein
MQAKIFIFNAVKLIRGYFNLLMLMIIFLFSGWLFVHYDDLTFNIIEDNIWNNLLYNRFTALIVCFFLGSICLYVINYFKIFQIKEGYTKEYINWSWTILVSSITSMYAKIVLSIYRCFSSSSFLDTVFDSNVLTIKRFWSRESLLNIIDKQVYIFNRENNCSLKLGNLEYENILAKCDGAETAIGLVKELCIQKLSLLQQQLAQTPSTTNWSFWPSDLISSSANFVVSNPKMVVGVIALVSIIGVLCRMYWVEYHTIEALKSTNNAVSGLRESALNSDEIVQNVRGIANTNTNLTGSFIESQLSTNLEVASMLEQLKGGLNQVSGSVSVNEAQNELLNSRLDNIYAALKTLETAFWSTHDLLIELEVLPSLATGSEDAQFDKPEEGRFPGTGRVLEDGANIN